MALNSNQSPRRPYNCNCPGTYSPQKAFQEKIQRFVSLRQTKTSPQPRGSSFNNCDCREETGYTNKFQKREIAFKKLYINFYLNLFRFGIQAAQ